MRVCIVFAVILLGWGCNSQTSQVTPKQPESSARQLQSFDEKEKRPIASELVPDRPLTLEPSVRYDDCHRLFEPGGQIHSSLPFYDQINAVIAGCDPEAVLHREGALFIAYGTPRTDGTEARDLRFAKFDNKGVLLWETLIDRVRNAKNFVANFRGSFIAPVDDKTMCAGTLWEGGTQTVCLDPSTGEQKWNGRIATWSGVAPVGLDQGLFVADLTAITKRYPFSGAEMKYRRLPGMGGRAGFYATDTDSLFFVPSRSDEAVLYRYDFKNLGEVWATKLPTHPMTSFSYVVDDILMLKIETMLYAISRETGLVRWGLDVGEDRPSVAHIGSVLYVLHRRPDEPNTLVAIDIKSGKPQYQAEMPSGILQVRAVDGELFVKGVRAIQRVTNP